jgi:dTDP-4-amino-4,6-dideoxygalactose transaminase
METQELMFIDLQTQKTRLQTRIEQAIHNIIEKNHFIMGPEVAKLEQQLSQFCGAKHVIGCSNGTDSLALILRAKNIGPNDAVIVPSFTFASTAEVVAWLGATPVFVDVLPDTFNMDPQSLVKGIQTAKELGLIPRCVISVDLFGQPADYDAIEDICHQHKLWLLSDAAQSFGATYKKRKVGTIGLATSTSFYPAKPLGCYGDGGAIFTDDDELADIIRSLRIHGQGKEKYDNVRIGINGRLDTIQAAVLLEKLTIFPEEIGARQHSAGYYNQGLKNIVQVPNLIPNVTSTWAQYTLRLKASQRDKMMAALRKDKIPTVVYYPKSLHQQTAYRNFPTAGRLTVSEALANEVLSLPMHPYLTEETQDYIIDRFTTCIKDLTS